MSFLIDNHGRTVDYLRLAVTDRCNLRCNYCMPENGIRYIAKAELMTYEEMFKTVNLLVDLGVKKLRLTGGEPFVRKDFMVFLRSLFTINGLEKIHLTTNGVLTTPYLSELYDLGIGNINLSLDALDRDRFFAITRRDEFPAVMSCLQELIDSNRWFKINCVLGDSNIEDILAFVDLTRNNKVEVRFIEEMPFNGTGEKEIEFWDYLKIIEHIKKSHPAIERLKDPPNSTSQNFQVPGFVGKVGVIPAFSRTFCGTCNRLRLTPRGLIKTCLYDDGVFNIKDLMRKGHSDKELIQEIYSAIGKRSKDGWEAEQKRKNGSPVIESMSTIGG